MNDDPIRLLDDPSTGALLRNDLGTATSATVQGLDRAAGLGALKAALIAETGAIPAVAGGSLLAKLLLGAAAVGGVAWWATGVVDVSMEPERVEAPVVAPAETIASAKAAQVPPMMPPMVSPMVSPPAPPPRPTDTADVVVPDEDPEPSSPDAKAGIELAAHASHASHEVAPSSPHGESSSFDDAVVREAKQIQAARRALASDPSRALSLTASIANEFPRGQLVEERLAIAIRALAKLGRLDEARTKADAFLETYGRGPHASSVRRAVGLED